VYDTEGSTAAGKIKPIWLNYESLLFLFRRAILLLKQCLFLLS
jgi:hypothetical protein